MTDRSRDSLCEYGCVFECVTESVCLSVCVSVPCDLSARALECVQIKTQAIRAKFEACCKVSIWVSSAPVRARYVEFSVGKRRIPSFNGRAPC